MLIWIRYEALQMLEIYNWRQSKSIISCGGAMWYVFILPHRATKPVKVRFALKTLTGIVGEKFA